MPSLGINALFLGIIAATSLPGAQNPIVLPHGEAGVQYSWILDACGLSVQPDQVCDATVVSKDFPRGLLLDSASRLSGVPAAKGTYSFTVRFHKYPNEVTDRVYSLEVKESDGPPAQISVNRSSLYFGVSPDGSVKTSPQVVSVTIQGEKESAWSAVSNNARFTFNGHLMDQDSRTRDFRVDAAAGALSEGMKGSVTVTSANPLPDSLHSIEVTQSVVDASRPPSGSFDTPLDNSVVWGTIPVAGWALDNIEVTKVEIWRDPVTPDEVSAASLVYIGDANFVPDARPDIEADHGEMPFNYRAAWGYTLLAKGLPVVDSVSGSGANSYKLHAIAYNKSGLNTDLGTRTITVDNNAGAKPFGNVDTPDPGITVSGEYTSFAWALTLPPYSIPTDGSTIWVGIDGQVVAHPVYNQYREDVAAAFPNFVNSRGAVGYYTFDTTKLSNGSHTISWLVADNGGRSQEIGSRAFQVRNAPPPNSQKTQTSSPQPAAGGVMLRQGFDQNQAMQTLSPGSQGDYSIQMEQLGRIELQVGATDGYQLVNGQRRPLPIGSSIKDGSFYWLAGLGFLGDFHLVLSRADSTEVRVNVKIVPKTYNPINQ